MMDTTDNQSGAGEALKKALDDQAQLATENFEQKISRMRAEGYEYNYDTGEFCMTYEGYCKFVHGGTSG
tara:strand:+ start:4910 stop:5116 length:207 start_codon:yes stop_codon:yes gene_type:complete